MILKSIFRLGIKDFDRKRLIFIKIDVWYMGSQKQGLRDKFTIFKSYIQLVATLIAKYKFQASVPVLFLGRGGQAADYVHSTPRAL